MSEQRRRGAYPVNMRDRVVRMVFESERDCGSQREAIRSVAEKLGPTAEMVYSWVRRAEIDPCGRPELESEEREQLKDLEREDWERRRANGISMSA